MATKIQLRRDTESNWSTSNPILAEGEIGISTDKNNFKIGNGVLSWVSLKYLLVGTWGSSLPGGVAVGKSSYSGGTGISVGKNSTSASQSTSIGEYANSKDTSISIGLSATSEDEGISIGGNVTSSNSGISIGEHASSTGGISIGRNVTSSNGGINIGGNMSVADASIQIGSFVQTSLKIPAVAGATDGMTLKVNTDGTIYAE